MVLMEERDGGEDRGEGRREGKRKHKKPLKKKRQETAFCSIDGLEAADFTNPVINRYLSLKNAKDEH